MASAKIVKANLRDFLIRMAKILLRILCVVVVFLMVTNIIPTELLIIKGVDLPVAPAFTRCLSCFCPLFHQRFSQISVEAQLNISRFPRHRHFVYPLCYYYCNRENGQFNDCNRKSGRFNDCSMESGRFYDCSGKSGRFIIAAGNRTIQMKGRSYNQICVPDSIFYPAAPPRS